MHGQGGDARQGRRERAWGAREVALLGALAALLLLAQLALAPLPNIELVSLLVIVYTVVLGPRALYAVYAFVLAEGLLYGFGLWWINYCYVWGVLALAVLPLRRQRAALLWAVVSGAFGLCFGALCALPYLIIGGLPAALAYWVAGIPFDLVHGAGNAIVALLLFRPLCRAMERLWRTGGQGVE